MAPPEPTRGIARRIHPSMTTFAVGDTTFNIDGRYTLRRHVGTGAFGCVVSVADSSPSTNARPVAVKKIADILHRESTTRAVVREVVLLRILGRSHPNILGLKDIMLDDLGLQVDVYLVSQLMDTDLERVLRSGAVLTSQHIGLLFAQLLSGVAHMHAQGIVHRDLKPGNCFVNDDCSLRCV